MSDINNVIIFKSENSKNIKTDKDNKYENL